MLKSLLILMVILAIILLIGLLIYSARFLNKVQKEQLSEKKSQRDYQLHPKLQKQQELQKNQEQQKQQDQNNNK